MNTCCVILKLAVFIMRTHYPSGRTWANILWFFWLCVSSILKDGHKLCFRANNLHSASFETYFKLETSSRHIMRLLPVFTLETHNQTNYRMFAPRSRRLEAVGERENGRARGRHATTSRRHAFLAKDLGTLMF